MLTTKIEIKNHLKEYLIGKFNGGEDGPVHFPDREDLYHILFDLTERRPQDCHIDRGNLEIALPDRRIGKSPETYNYLSQRSVKYLERKIEIRFRADMHEFMDEQKHVYGNTFIDAAHLFLRRYCITSLTEDAVIKNYYRWRSELSRKTKKRGYTKKVSA